MSEIEKLYENAGVKGFCKNFFKDLMPETCLKECEEEDYKCKDCDCWELQPFTAEKQLELMKLISKQGQVIIENWEKDNRGFNVTFRANSNLRYITMDCITRKTVEEALAQILNDLWQDLTEEEKAEIKRILE